MQNLNIYLEKMIGEQIADRDIDEALDLLQIVPEIQKQLDDPTHLKIKKKSSRRSSRCRSEDF